MDSVVRVFVQDETLPNEALVQNSHCTISVATASMVKLHEISVEAYVPHAVFVPFIGLTSLRTDSGRKTDSSIAMKQRDVFSSLNNKPRLAASECIVVIQRACAPEYPSQRLRSSPLAAARKRWLVIGRSETSEEERPPIGDLSPACDDRRVGGEHLDDIPSEFH